MTASGGIVWLASFPKSGNTWFRIFLANLSAGVSGPSDINDLDERGGIAASRIEFEAVTMLDSGLVAHDDIDDLRPRVYEAIAAEAKEQRWIKVHDAYGLTPSGERLFGRHAASAAVYLVRDPRDVAVSYAHHMNMTVDNAIRLMNDPECFLGGRRRGLALQLRQKVGSWSGNVTSWLDQSDVPVHPVRYEDLIVDPVAKFTAALQFAGRAATQVEIDRAVQHADFAELRQQESEKGFVERVSRKVPFFRSGRVGGWREALSAEQIDAIEKCHGAVMARLGYK